MQKGALKKNRVAYYSKIVEKATKKDRVTRHSINKKEIEDANKDIFEIDFLN